MAHTRSRRRAHIRVVDDVYGGAPLRTLHGVPTFSTLQGICGKYLEEHRFTQPVEAGPSCACGLDVADFAGWLDHVTELQASHLAEAIQDARDT